MSYKIEGNHLYILKKLLLISMNLTSKQNCLIYPAIRQSLTFWIVSNLTFEYNTIDCFERYLDIANMHLSLLELVS